MKARDDGTRPTWPRWHPHSWNERLKIVGTLAIAFAVWGWIDVRARGTIDPENPHLHRTDFTVYTEAGAAFFDGRKPYEVTNPRGWPYLYPPPFAMLVSPLHALSAKTQVLLWFALSVAMAYGCYSESVRIARAVMPGRAENVVFGPIPLWIGWTAVAAVALPALNCLQRGQVTVAKLYLLLLGFRLCCNSPTLRRSLLAGGVLALPIVLKITPLVPVALVVCLRLAAAWLAESRAAALRHTGALATGVAGGLVVTLLLLPAAAVGWRANLHHLDTWLSLAVTMNDICEQDTAGDLNSPRNQSMENSVRRLGNWAHHWFAGGPDDRDPLEGRMHGLVYFMDAPFVGTLLLVVRAVAACLLAGVGVRLARREDMLGEAAAFGLACVATLILSPIARGLYYVLFMPAVMFTSAWLARNGRARAAVWMAVAPTALIVAQYVWLDFAGRIGLLGIGTTLWYAAACVMLLRTADVAAASAEPVSTEPRQSNEQRALAA